MRQELYYSPTILGFEPDNSGEPIHTENSGIEEHQSHNSILFKRRISTLFESCRDKSDNYEWSRVVLEESKVLLVSLINDYIERTEGIMVGYDRTIQLLKWMIHTRDCIDDVFDNYPDLTFHIPTQGGKDFPIIYTYRPFRDYLIIILCYAVVGAIHGSVVKNPSDSTSLSILYNFWGEEFDKKYRSLFPMRAGVIEDDDKAIVSSSFNRERYIRRISDDWNRFFIDENSMYYVIDDVNCEVDDIGIRRLFNDYQRRVYALCEDGFSDADKFNLQVEWVLETVHLGFDVFCSLPHCTDGKYSSTDSGIINAELRRYNIVFLCFFSHLLDILSALLTNHDLYFSDDKGEKTEYSLGSYTPVLIGQIYDLMLSKLTQIQKTEGFKLWSRNDFIKRVYSADLKPYWIDGARSVMKYNIRKLHEEAEVGWLEAVASNLGVTPDKARGKSGYDLPNGYEADFPSPRKRKRL